MAENNEPADPEPPANRPSPPAVPRRHKSVGRQSPEDPEDSDDVMADFVDNVKVLAKRFTEDEGEATETKERSGRRIKKFQRSGLGEDRPVAPPAQSSGNAAEDKQATVESLPPAPAATVEEKSDAAAFNKHIAWPRAGQAEAAEEQARPATQPKRNKRKKRVVLAVVQGVGFGLLLFGFWLGRQTAPTAEDEAAAGHATPAPPTPGGNYRISERALQAANDALAAAHKGNLDGARKILDEALAKTPDLPGVQYQLARISLETGDLLDADVHLDRSSDAGEFMAACCYSRARFAGMKGNYAEAVRQFEIAAHEEPFHGTSFFYWAEALRRQGQTLNAIEVFDQAIDRAHTETEGVLYQFKQRLAKVEAGNDEAFNAELADHLKQPTVAGEWLLLSAARDINRRAFPAAAETLKKAAAALPTADYNLAVKDYLFQSAASEPALAPLVQRPRVPDSTEQNGPFVDPTVASPSLADPAIWPVAVQSSGGGQ